MEENKNNFLLGMLFASEAMKKLNKITEDLKNIANEDNYTEEREKELVVELVDTIRGNSVVIKEYISSLYALWSFDSDISSDISTAASQLTEALHVVTSIASAENSYGSLIDGKKWIGFDKYEPDSGFELSSIKELVLGKIMVMSSIIGSINEAIIRKKPTEGYHSILKLINKITSSNIIDVPDITSLCNTLDKKVLSLDIDKKNEIKNKIRNTMGLVDGSLNISRRLNLSEIESLRTQAIYNFSLAARIKYTLEFMEDLAYKNLELNTQVAKNIELEKANSGLVIDAEMSSLYPRIFPRAISVFNGAIILSADFTNDPSQTSLDVNLNPFLNGMIKDDADLEIMKEHFFKTYIQRENNSSVEAYDLIKDSTLETAYDLVIVSSLALTIVVGELLSTSTGSEAITKKYDLSEILSKSNEVESLIISRVFESENLEFKICDSELSLKSVENLISRKIIFSKSANRLVDSLLSDIKEDSANLQGSLNAIVIASRIASFL